jgi:hypothetical protein
MRIDYTSTEARKVHWDYIVKIGDVLHDDTLSFEQKRDEVARRILASGAVREDTDRSVDLRALAEELQDAADVDEYDWIMDDIYDLADTGKFLWVGP